MIHVENGGDPENIEFEENNEDEYYDEEEDKEEDFGNNVLDFDNNVSDFGGEQGPPQQHLSQIIEEEVVDTH